MIEYILVVTVSVIIVLGLAQRMYKPLGDFIEGFMGTYVACLLETGELPILGANTSGSGECKIPIMGAGDPLDGGASSPGSQTNSNSKPPDDGDKVTNDRGGNDSGSGGGGGGGRGSGSSRRFTVGAGTASGDGGGGAAGRKIVIALEGGGSGSFFGNQSGGGSGSIYRRGSRYVAVTGSMAQEAQERQEREANRSITQKVDGGTGGTQKKKMAVVPPPPKSTALLEDEIKGIDYSQIVKYILIAGIIIILLALIGGQALQLSKSWEKGE
ncbi:MAG TPA: hypothetical protein PL182_02215 [Pseudobdellovibrionaceae bacterium]|nr:hypothetical protein [Pseudobdellovibrionaceae bacterium]